MSSDWVDSMVRIWRRGRRAKKMHTKFPALFGGRIEIRLMLIVDRECISFSTCINKVQVNLTSLEI